LFGYNNHLPSRSSAISLLHLQHELKKYGAKRAKKSGKF